MLKLVKINERGRRIGEDHPRAVLSDHDVGLLWEFLEEREALIARMTAAGAVQREVEAALTKSGLSYRLLAAKFDVHKQTVAKVAQGARRCQAIAKRKPYP
jgi:transposase